MIIAYVIFQRWFVAPLFRPPDRRRATAICRASRRSVTCGSRRRAPTRPTGDAG
jgi:hypothetical protein